MGSRLERVLALHCSPALFGIKSSNLINCNLKDYPNLEEDILNLNNEFKDKIGFNILSKENDHILLLVYKIKKLQETIFDSKNHQYLINNGYPNNYNLDDYLNCLKRRVIINNFPHEIGVFLGYDLNDIIDFSKGNKKPIHVGYWSVYSNIEEKIKLFNKFTKCREVVTNLVMQGKALESMI